MRLRRLAALGLLVAATGLAALAWLLLIPTPALRAGPLVVEIPAHQGVLRISQRLAAAGAIRSETAFLALAAATGRTRQLKAGEYELPRGASPTDVLEQLAAGRVRQHAVLHPEGATVSELARVLEGERLAAADDILRAAADPRVLQTLGLEAPSVEGYLFPDTYHFVRGMAAEEILGRMVQRTMAKLTPGLRARAAEQGLSVHQLLTLASIIEREAVVDDERRLISAVFWNRLRLDMPLQADPTVQYAVAKERRALTRADLQLNHPYNTYQRRGLPPGPIASPGLAAIEAALDPAPVQYLYFVAKDDRRHHFSVTVEQHNAAVARYRTSRR